MNSKSKLPGLLALGAVAATAIAALVVASCTPQRQPDVLVLASGADLESANPLVTTHPLSQRLATA